MTRQHPTRTREAAEACGGLAPPATRRCRGLKGVVLGLASAGIIGSSSLAGAPPETDSGVEPAGFTTSAPGPDGFRYEALLRPARFRDSKTATTTGFEEQVVTYTEPETVYRTIVEEKGCWKVCCCPTLLGWRAVCIWCPQVVQTQLAETVQVTKQRVERVQVKQTRDFRKTLAESVVIQSRRIPNSKASGLERNWGLARVQTGPSSDGPEILHAEADLELE